MSAERAHDLRNLMQKFDPVQDEALFQNAYPILDKLESSARSLGATDLGDFARQRNMSLPPVVRDFPISLSHAFMVAAGWVFATIVVTGLLVWRRWSRSGVQLFFEDLSQGTCDKAQRDRLLMQNIQQAFWIPRTELSEDGLEDLQFDAPAYRDGYGFGSLAPRQPLIPWGELVTSETPIKIGPVAFNPKQLLSMLASPLQIKRKFSLVGFLHDDGVQQILVAQQIDRAGRPVAGRSWKARLKSGENRDELIRDLAAQIIVEWPVSEVTNIWRSYREFEQGLQLLSQQRENSNGCQCMQQISQHFEKALSYDPANWMARFYLAIARRRQGDYGRAAEHLRLLETLLIQANRELPLFNRIAAKFKSPVVRHVLAYPQCTFLVLYNRAMALADSQKPDKVQEALDLLDRIIAMKKGKSQSEGDLSLRKTAWLLKRDDRKRFVMLALSAKSAVLAAQLKIEAQGRADERVIGEIRQRIHSIYTTVQCSQQCLKPEMLTSHTLALAITHNSEATALALDGNGASSSNRYAEAERLYEKAIVILPDMIDSYLNLASLYIFTQKRR
jgi:tetratricopeptide (TPR) repeat protein